MSVIQKTDKYSETFAKLAELGFTSDDIFLTMRFSELETEEAFSHTMAFGNSRLFLYTGIAQCQREAEALEKYKAANYHAEEMSDKDKTLLPKPDAKFDPKEVDDFLDKWEKYQTNLPPYDPINIVVILNYLQSYNSPLQWWASAWEPIQRAGLNTRYAGKGGRTFNGMIKLGLNMFQREHETQIGRSSRSLRHPFGQKKEEEEN